MAKKSKSLLSCKELSEIIKGMSKQVIEGVVASDPDFSIFTYRELPVGVLLKWLEDYEDYEIQKTKEE